MQAIGLTPAQRMLDQESVDRDDDVMAAGRRIRQARRALDRAIMAGRIASPRSSATEALAGAQADKIRLDRMCAPGSRRADS
jgi:hypothetical protein